MSVRYGTLHPLDEAGLAGVFTAVKVIRLAIVSTHPIQYYAPIFQTLARSARVRPKVFFTWSQTADAPVVDPGFGRPIKWDIPLLEGYEYEFVPNIARNPGTDHFGGLRNPGLNAAIESWRPDAVLVFGWNSVSHLRALLHFKGKLPVFFRGDSMLLDRVSGWRAAARRIFLTWVYRHIAVAIAVGSNNKDYYRWCGVPQTRIAFAPHSVDTQRFAATGGQHESGARQWREELQIPAAARVVLFAGKLQPKKDPLLLLEAFLQCGGPGHLVFVGSGELASALQERARGRPDVHFLPFQNQQAMPAVYRIGDVFALPSCGPGETWGLALNEAMACGRPVIASSKVGGARDLLGQAGPGWVFESGNRQQLEDVLHSVFTCGAQELRMMGEAARRESARWSIEETAARIEEIVSPQDSAATAALFGGPAVTRL
jgi:glycosyltransferase involved in cell wall biosynthesis